jgi:hypothetical protein
LTVSPGGTFAMFTALSPSASHFWKGSRNKLVMTTSKRGWSSEGLQVVSQDDPGYWSTADAANLLGPPELTQAQVRQLIRLSNLQPAGKRRVTMRGRGGRHVRVYRASELIRAHDAIAQVLTANQDSE